jgi:hypothetical protein
LRRGKEGRTEEAHLASEVEKVGVGVEERHDGARRLVDVQGFYLLLQIL